MLRPSQIALMVVAGVMSAQMSPAQEAPKTVISDIVNVELVNVDVWVSDERGRSIEGLTAEDFELRHDGVSVEISHFAEIRDRAPATQAVSERAVDQDEEHLRGSRPHLVLVFDQRQLSASGVRRLLGEIQRFLDGGEVAPERVLVLRLDSALSIETPFGSSRGELDRAWQRLEQSLASGTSQSTQRDLVVRELQDLWTEFERPQTDRSLRSVVSEVTGVTASQGLSASGGGGLGAQAGGGVGPSTGQACDDFVDRAESIVLQWAERERQETLRVVTSLADVSSFVSGVEGMKVVLYVSEGLNIMPGSTAASFVRGVCPAYQTSLESDAVREGMRSHILALTRRANANRITFYALQESIRGSSLAGTARQASADSRGVRSFETSWRTVAAQGLDLLTGETGGRTLSSEKNLAEALGKLGSDLGAYYSLAYVPPQRSDATAHQIDLALRDESLTARHRRGYSDKTTDEWLTERLESALYLGLVTNPLGARLGAGKEAAATESTFRLPFHVMLPASGLTYVPQEGRAMARVVIKIMALNAETRSLMMTDRRVFLPKPQHDSGGTIDLALDLELAAGVHMVAVAVQDSVSREASFVSTTLEVGPRGPAS